MERAADEFGEPSVLVNNAAILDVGAISEMAPELLTRIVMVNQVGPYLGIQAMIDPMKRHGGGSIVNVASIDAMKDRTEPLPNRPIHPFNRSGEMVDFANAILWLATDESSYVSGIDLTVDGGFTAGKIEPGAPFP